MLLGESRMRASSGDKRICSLYAMSTSWQVSHPAARSTEKKLFYDVTFLGGLISVLSQLEFVSLCFWKRPWFWDMSKFIRLEALTIISCPGRWKIKAGQEMRMWRGLLLLLLCVFQMRHSTAAFNGEYIYLINQVRGPYWENIGPRSWQYGPSAATSIQIRPRADILPVRSRASLVNKRFITRLKFFRRKA